MTSRIVPLNRMQVAGASECGLERDEVERRLAEYGPNDIIESPPSRWWHLILETAKDPMLWFFAGTSILYAIVGQHTEAITLLVAILPLLGMDIYLHKRTQASTAGLASRLASTATVLRSGLEQTVASEELVPGDLVLAGLGWSGRSATSRWNFHHRLRYSD